MSLTKIKMDECCAEKADSAVKHSALFVKAFQFW
jgi:hypothetical protein